MKFSFSTVVTLITLLVSTSAESTSLRGGSLNHEDGTDINQRALGLYPNVSVKNDTPHNSNYVYVGYGGLCANDKNTNFMASGGTWTGPDRYGCLVNWIHSILILDDGSELDCKEYTSHGTGYSDFFIILIDGQCCVRSSHESFTECP